MTTHRSPSSGTAESAQVETSPSHSAFTMQPAKAPATATAKPASKSKPRKRVNTLEKRNQHNAIERQRRENLNSKFISLARLLPSLASHRRPSKSAIVNGSISHLTHQRNQRLLASRLLRQLCAERDSLAKECNEWRTANGFPAKDTSSAWTEEMDEVCGVEKEVFGTFANMPDEDQDGDDNENEQEPENENETEAYEGNPVVDMSNMTLEQAAAVAAQLNISATGLITPRSSTDIDPAQLARSMLIQSTQQQPQPLQHQDSISASSGASWPGVFSFDPNTNSLSHQSASSASLPFSAFMSDSMSPGESPTNSHHASSVQNGMPTPPTTADFAAFTHTPSPRSSHSLDEIQNLQQQQQRPLQQQQQQAQVQQQQQRPWTDEQLLFLQAVQQQQLQRQAAQARQMGNNMGQIQGHVYNPSILHNSFAAQNFSASDQFTQNLIASVFPQQANVHVGNGNGSFQTQPMPQAPPSLTRAQTEHMEAWRRMSAMPGQIGRVDAQPTVAELKNALRAGMGMGLGMGAMWEQGSQNAVKGF